MQQIAQENRGHVQVKCGDVDFGGYAYSHGADPCEEGDECKASPYVGARVEAEIDLVEASEDPDEDGKHSVGDGHEDGLHDEIGQSQHDPELLDVLDVVNSPNIVQVDQHVQEEEDGDAQVPERLAF